MVSKTAGWSSIPGMVRKQKAQMYMPTSYANMVLSRAIRQAKYKALTSSYHAGGGDQQPAVSGNSEDLTKRLPGERYTSRVEICGALGRQNIVIWWHNNQNSNAN